MPQHRSSHCDDGKNDITISSMTRSSKHEKLTEACTKHTHCYTYEQSPTAVTMILSGVMVKMGVLGVIRSLMPVLHLSFYQWGDTVSTLAITGMLYASLIAIQQDDLKRLVAYSSIAHVGLMCATLFAETHSGMQGVMIQMFNHGINIIGFWIVIELIERQFGTRKISELGGLGQRSPAMAILLVVVALANIGLPLTNGFIGEFLMFNGIFASVRAALLPNERTASVAELRGRRQLHAHRVSRLPSSRVRAAHRRATPAVARSFRVFFPITAGRASARLCFSGSRSHAQASGL